MNTLTNFALQTKFEKVKSLRPNFYQVNNLINWNNLVRLFPEKEETRGAPEYEKVLMLKIIFLQSCYSISDEEMEYQINDRLSFQQFLGFPESIPDYTTIWRFREELTEENILELIWSELQDQITNKGIVIEKGVIQDAKFITADPGKTNSGLSGRGQTAKTSRSRDGTWTKKGKKSVFGFKMHTKVEKKNKLILEMGLTTARVHDGRVDLANEDEINYRDRGYSGCKTKAKADATMKRGKLSIQDKLRNKRITRKRCRGEHPFGFMVRSLKAGHTRLTTIPRVYVQQAFVCIAYNFNRLNFLLARAM